MRRRQLLAEVKRLRGDNARMSAAIGRKDAQLLVAKCDCREAELALAGLQIELRGLRGFQAALTAGDRAMPEGDAA